MMWKFQGRINQVAVTLEEKEDVVITKVEIVDLEIVVGLLIYNKDKVEVTGDRMIEEDIVEVVVVVEEEEEEFVFNGKKDNVIEDQTADTHMKDLNNHNQIKEIKNHVYSLLKVLAIKVRTAIFPMIITLIHLIKEVEVTFNTKLLHFTRT